MPAIVVDSVTHAYEADRRTVLRAVSVTLTERRIGIVGANGSGKSTFARLLNGLIIPAHGTVTVDGLDTRRQSRQVRRKVGFCFTIPDSQIVMPTVAEDIAFGLRRRGLSAADVRERVAPMLELSGLAGHADHPTHLLSGGQKQLLALASVLVTEPEVLVLDEPTTLLDVRNARRVHALIDSLEQQVVVVSHQLELLDSFDRVLVFDDAELVHDGPPADAIAGYLELMR